MAHVTPGGCPVTTEPQPVPAPSAPAPAVEPAPAAAAPAAGPAPVAPQHHQLKRTRISGLWVAMGFFAVVLLLLLIFILQNGTTVQIAYFGAHGRDRKSTRLNSSHSSISYAVFCLK